MADLSGMANAAASAVKIRPAAGTDIPAIVVLLADDALGRGREDLSAAANRAYAEALERVEADSCNVVWVAELDGMAVGTMQTILIHGLAHRGATRLEIEAVRVSSRRRGMGIGEALIRFAVEEARRQGAGIVQLTSDASRQEAHRFYERLGFTASHVGFKLRLD
ncbi:MAG TPA: GNAT family N-acetyltransferase [Afifellaceae bacterium]|nr:GNAT family N-acetyltransferase [Afifellaceae bacterium]